MHPFSTSGGERAYTPDLFPIENGGFSKRYPSMKRIHITPNGKIIDLKSAGW